MRNISALANRRILNLIVLAFCLTEFAVFGDEFHKLAKIAAFGAEAGEGGQEISGLALAGNRSGLSG
ncbi:MAG: hypothetical protein MJZ78_08530 [Bacteroidales bacterium]|nr:hypothetical protein [Bacteroidales bacterium]